MIQGTTPTHTFKVPIDTAIISNVRITYAQDGAVVLTKEKNDCKMGEGFVSVKLTQEETFNFDDELPVDIQMRILTMGGDALASKPERVPLRTVLDGEVIM